MNRDLLAVVRGRNLVAVGRIQADLFARRPERLHDAVFRISGRPTERRASVWVLDGASSRKAACFFCGDTHSNDDELIEVPVKAPSAAAPRTAPPTGSLTSPTPPDL